MQIRLAPTQSLGGEMTTAGAEHLGSLWVALRSAGGVCGVRFALPRKPGSSAQTQRNER